MMRKMRTTIDLSDALLDELKSLARTRQQPMKAVIEETLRRGLAAGASAGAKRPLPTFAVGIKPAYRGTSMNQLYDQLETDGHLKVAEE